jgi:hypothetical protein
MHDREPAAKTLSIPSSDDRPGQVDAFIAAVLNDTGRKITRRDIWRVAGYEDKTQFSRWQANKRATQKASNVFPRIIKLNPREFLAKLKNIKS